MSDTKPRAFAYADPPYLGCSHFYDHPEAGMWDDKQTHIDLIAAMEDDFDGWAYSCNSKDLLWLGPHLPSDIRIASWVKPFAAFKRNVPIAYTWEPVIFRRASNRRDGDPIGRDHLAEVITMKRGFIGAKPQKFNRWVLDIMGYQNGDVLHDFFPGTGGMSVAVDAAVLDLSYGSLPDFEQTEMAV
jgi:hypothetical protein